MSRSQHYDSAMVGTIISRHETDEKIQYVPTTSTLPKLDSGNYNVFAFFWSDTTEDNRISAGLTEDRMMEFRTRSCQAAEVSQFAQPVKVAEGNRLLYRAFLGRMKAISGQLLGPSVRDITGTAFAGLGYQRAE